MKKTNEELFLEYKKETDSYNKDEILSNLYKQNKNFPHHIAKGFKNSILPYDEIVNLAVVGMVKSFKTYDPSYSKFTTYSSKIMTNEILMELRKAEYKKSCISMNIPIGDGNVSLGDMIEDFNVNFEKIFEAKETIKTALRSKSIKLKDLELTILLNQLSDNPKTQKELGDELNVEQSYISRLQRSAFKKMKDVI